jgi:putative transposase
MTTNSRHTWCVVPNLTRGMVLNGLDQLWVADITYLHLAEEFGYLIEMGDPPECPSLRQR